MVKVHKCPICSKLTDDEKYRPFCSKRCADIDLGHWFDGSYAVPAEQLDDTDYEELEKELSDKKDKSI
ncbi:MAG: DNA gyrase inhibitor YacG [Alphaproteobacteria bacterium]|nr:DNA gyrase inhibitor YacG [Alphaproteobacteria bacterium]